MVCKSGELKHHERDLYGVIVQRQLHMKGAGLSSQLENIPELPWELPVSPLQMVPTELDHPAGAGSNRNGRSWSGRVTCYSSSKKATRDLALCKVSLRTQMQIGLLPWA